MSRCIDADALLNEVMERHCKECDKRKGIKNGKYRIIYEIGDAPCRACDVDDFTDELENAPTIEPRCEVCEAFNKTRILIPQPERKKGKWIDYTEDGYVECPFCHSATNCDGNKDELHFCFSCGADMREDGEEPKKCDTCRHEKSQWFNRCADCSDYELWEGKEE